MQFDGLSGGGLRDFAHLTMPLHTVGLDILLIQLGGNDLTGVDGLVQGVEGLVQGKTATPVIKLAQALVDHARALQKQDGGPPRVAIGKLLYRGISNRLPTARAKNAYNAKVEAVNAELDRLARILEPCIRVWSHKGREQCADEMLGPDGLGKYWWSWRRALISTKAQLDPGQYMVYFPRSGRV